MAHRLGSALALLSVLAACSAPRDDDGPASSPAPSGSSPGAGLSGPGGSGPAPPVYVSGGAGAAVPSGGAPNLPMQGGGAGSSGASTGGAPLNGGCDFPHQRVVEVTSVQSLANALGSAAPGTLIRLPDAELPGEFSAGKSGSATDPIVLCGSSQAVLRADSGGGATVLTVTGDHWVLSGFTVVGGQKGVLLDGANHNLLTGLTVHGTGNEAVHFRAGSSDNVLEWSRVYDTGRENAEFGEGVYIGSAASQWQKFSDSADVPDRSDRNVVRNNRLGPDVRAELIDVKEGTTSGKIHDNTLDGSGIVSDGFADSWIDVKGNGYLLEGNQGTDSPADGFQVHVVKSGWGKDNVFRKNRATVNADGYGFRISAEASGTVVSCDNVVTAAGAGLSNIGCRN